MSAEQLHDRLASSYTIPGGARAVHRELSRWSCFQEGGDGEYQVGRALIVRPDPTTD
jgi:hypothetical protein